jgi:fused signal recognition particle receptor
MTIAAIAVALVVIAAIVAFLARGKGGAALQAPTNKAPSALAPSKARSAPPASGVAPAPRPAPAQPPMAGAPESLAPSSLISDSSTPAAPAAPPVLSSRDIESLRKGLAATRGGFVAKLVSLFQGKRELDPATLQQLEEIMLAGDVGPKTTQAILQRLGESLGRSQSRDPDAIGAALRAEARRILSFPGGAGIRLAGKPTVVLMVGVNGVGKTTTIGKLATRYGANNKKVVLAAGDTFRAAAVQQLEVWGKRVGAEVVRGKEGADPGAVAFDATVRAKESGADILFVDTAGRLHTKAPLMDEIKKVRKTIAKALDGAPHETLLVLDATTGQNGLQQAALFREALDLTGVVLTKLDGTAKGGVVLAICDELRIPVRYVGLGERAEDLREFHPDEFVEALFGSAEDVGPGGSPSANNGNKGPIAAAS